MKKINTEASMVYDEKLVKASFGYLGQEGYFSNYKDFDVYIEGVLESVTVSNGSNYPYTNKYDCNGFDYFIPKNFVVFFKEEKEKKLRPFKYMSEFFDKTGFKVGEVITIKRFGCDDQEYEETCVFSGYRIVTNTEPQITTVVFGNNRRTFNELKNGFKYYKNGEWLPFGIEE